jgi:hypothetical protein
MSLHVEEVASAAIADYEESLRKIRETHKDLIVELTKRWAALEGDADADEHFYEVIDDLKGHLEKSAANELETTSEQKIATSIVEVWVANNVSNGSFEDHVVALIDMHGPEEAKRIIDDLYEGRAIRP